MIENDPLTAKQSEILRAISRGNSEKDLVSLFRISIFTVKSHKRAIVKALKCRNITHAAVKYSRR